MGWKKVKEHYRIKHYVCVQEKGICIGSGYISDLLVIDLQGTLIKGDDRLINEDLARYQSEMVADPDLLRQLVLCVDTFAISIPVYAYEGGEVIERKCESAGWPNVTHDGHMQYDNTHSTDKSIVIAWAKKNANAGVEMAKRGLADAEKSLVEAREWLTKKSADLQKLNDDYPDLTPSPA